MVCRYLTCDQWAKSYGEFGKVRCPDSARIARAAADCGGLMVSRHDVGIIYLDEESLSVSQIAKSCLMMPKRAVSTLPDVRITASQPCQMTQPSGCVDSEFLGSTTTLRAVQNPGGFVLRQPIWAVKHPVCGQWLTPYR